MCRRDWMVLIILLVLGTFISEQNKYLSALAACVVG